MWTIIVLGSTHWSPFFLLLGLGLIALAPLMARLPDAAPLLYGGTVAGCLWYWTYAVKFGAHSSHGPINR